jgi:WD40 repeat protein
MLPRVTGTAAKWPRLTSFTRGLLAAASAAAGRTSLGVVIGTDVQAFDAQLFSNIPQNSKSAAYTTVLTDGGKHIFHPSADTTARIWTIDSNANVAYPVGTAITFINQNGGGVITIAITSDTMRLAGAGTTGSRALAANGIATAIKVATTEWIISGTGLT